MPSGIAPQRDGGHVSVVEGSTSSTVFLMTRGKKTHACPTYEES